MKVKIRAWKMGLVKACHEGAFVEGEVDADEGAGVHGMEVVVVAYLEAAQACAEGVVGVAVVASAEDFVDIPAADQQQEATGVDQEEEEVLQRAQKQEEAASALPGMHQEIESIVALQLQHQEQFLHFESIQEEMVLELLVVQVQRNCQGSDHQGQDFVHHNLVEDSNGQKINQ